VWSVFWTAIGLDELVVGTLPHYTITINISGGSSANPWQQHDNNSTNNGLKEELIRCGDNNDREREKERENIKF